MDPNSKFAATKSVAEAVRIMVAIRQHYERLDGNPIWAYVWIWDKLGGKPGSLLLRRSELAHAFGRNARVVTGYLETLSECRLIDVGKPIDNKWPVYCREVAEAVDEVRLGRPPQPPDPQLMLLDQGEDASPPAIESQATLPLVVVARSENAAPYFPSVGEFGAVLSESENPAPYFPTPHSSTDRGNDSPPRDLEQSSESDDDAARSLLSRSSSHLNPSIQNHPSHPPKPILPSTTEDLPLQLKAGAAKLAAARSPSGRSLLGDQVVEEAKWLAGKLEASLDGSDFWMFVWAAYLRQVEGGLTGKEFRRPLDAATRNAQSSRPAYWVRAFQTLIERKGLPWPDYESMRTEFDRVGIGWHEHWDKAWRTRNRN